MSSCVEKVGEKDKGESGVEGAGKISGVGSGWLKGKMGLTADEREIGVGCAHFGGCVMLYGFPCWCWRA